MFFGWIVGYFGYLLTKRNKSNTLQPASAIQLAILFTDTWIVDVFSPATHNHRLFTPESLTMLTLSALKSIRVAKGIARPLLADLAAMTRERLRELELRDAEPWFDEAVSLHRVLNTAGVAALISSCDMTVSALGPPLPNDLELWRGGGRASLSLALRVARALGLADAADLAVPPLMRQVWDVVQATERHPEAPGWCPWCAADVMGGDPHRATCLADNLLRRAPDGPAATTVAGLRPASRGEQQKGLPAPGLKAARIQRELIQRDVASFLGIHANHYARIERGEVPLARIHADRLAAAWGIDVAALYAKGEADG